MIENYMKRPTINELFIYYRCHGYALDVLRNQTVYCSKAAAFNDPFDCAIPLTVDYDTSDIVAAIVRRGIKDGDSWETIRSQIDGELDSKAALSPAARKRIEENANNFINENKEMGILCLTEDPKSVLMWSHYADKHRGACLGFTRTPSNDLGDDDACSPVTYSDVFPSPRFLDILKTDGAVTKQLLYTKALQWAYEKEWRLFTRKGGEKVNIPGTLSRIILGCSAPSEVVNDFKAEAERLAIPIFQACKVDGMFALSLELIK